MRNKVAKALRREALLYARSVDQTAHRVTETLSARRIRKVQLPALNPDGTAQFIEQIVDMTTIRNTSGVKFFHARLKKAYKAGLIRLKTTRRPGPLEAGESMIEFAVDQDGIPLLS